MGGRRDDTIRRILDLEERVHRAVGWGDPRAWMGADLGSSQLKVLFLLRAQGESHMGGIAEALKVGKAAVSETVDRLQAQGLVERSADPKDRRLVVARLTAAGADLAGRLSSAGHGQTARLLAAMDELELDQVRLGLEAMGRAAERLAAEQDA